MDVDTLLDCCGFSFFSSFLSVLYLLLNDLCGAFVVSPAGHNSQPAIMMHYLTSLTCFLLPPCLPLSISDQPFKPRAQHARARRPAVVMTVPQTRSHMSKHIHLYFVLWLRPTMVASNMGRGYQATTSPAGLVLDY